MKDYISSTKRFRISDFLKDQEQDMGLMFFDENFRKTFTE